PLARIHYVVRAQGRLNDAVDLVELETRVALACKRWEDGVQVALMGEGVERARQINAIALGFSSAYRDDFSAETAAQDAVLLQGLSDEQPLALHLYARGDQLHFKTYETRKLILSDALP